MAINVVTNKMESKNKKETVKDYVTNIYGRIKIAKETELIDNNKVIGKYWVFAQTVYYGIRPNRAKAYDTLEKAQDVFVKMYDLGIEGDFVIAKDIETGKFFIKAQ